MGHFVGLNAPLSGYVWSIYGSFVQLKDAQLKALPGLPSSLGAICQLEKTRFLDKSRQFTAHLFRQRTPVSALAGGKSQGAA
jgi:hypothetical protein